MIIISIAFLVGVGFYLPFYPVSAYPTYPQTGIIAMWTGSSIPSGWEVATDTTSRFVMGTNTGETPGAYGGSSSHRHTYTQLPYHGHGYTSSSSMTHSHSYTGGGTTANKGTSGSDITTLYPGGQYGIGGSTSVHTHTVAPYGSSTCNSQYSSSYPPYQTVTYIKKVSAAALFPAGLIVISTSGSIPSGWVRCDGSNGTPDLRGDFLMGSGTPGLTGGSTSHNHAYTTTPYHSHSMQGDGDSHTHGAYHNTMSVKADDWATFAYDVVRATSGTSSTYHHYHSHSMGSTGSSTCYTSSSSILPTYTAVDFLMTTQTVTALPEGVVALWDGSASTIPYGWDACDGSSGTADLRNRFVRGRVSEAPGTRGGSTSHAHTYTSIPSHTHSVVSGDAYHMHNMNLYGGLSVGAETILGLGSTVYVASGSRSTTTTTFSHNHYINYAGSSSCSTYSASNYPPYVKLTYIQCNDYEPDAPVFTDVPSDRSLEFGFYTGESISWTSTDAHPDVYTVDLLGSGTVAGPSSWGSGSPITYNIPDGFDIGLRTYEIEVFDKYGRSSSDSVTLNVQDTTAPAITPPSPLTVEYGYTGQSLSWTATEFNPDYYQIVRVGTGIVVGPTGWSSGSPVTYNIPDGFGAGVYTYNITFMDDYGNSDWSTATFTVEDTTKPTFTSIPDDIIVEYGYSSLNVSWTGTDPYPSTYTVERLDIGIVEGPLSWSSGAEINYTVPLGLGVGTYTYTMNITDIFGNDQTDSMNFTVEDTTDPIIGTPASNLVVELGYTSQSFSWVVTDPYAENYTIELDSVGTVVEWTPWTSGTDIVYSIPNGLDEGTYTYTLNVTDEFGNHANHMVTLTVEPDTTDPVIASAPADITVEEGYSSQTFTWTTTDLFPGTYTIELSGTGTVVDHTAWVSGDTLTYSIPNGLSAGTYTYTITFYDEFGNSILDSVVFTVEAAPSPTIPGFGVPVILFITAFTIFTMILVLKKKKKIT